jgi:hypothetical protein
MARKLALFVCVIFFVAACAVAPRTSSWEGPKRFTKAQVFNAAMQAGAEQGMQVTSSSEAAGTISMTKRVGDGNMNLNVVIKQDGPVVDVKTTAAYGGGLAIRGLHEEIIRNFHVFMFRNLNITKKEERLVRIDGLK